MESFIPWIGGKKLLRNEIINQFPIRIEAYVEVFGGAGWVMFAKDKHTGKEVFNDIDGNLINLYRCMKYHGRELQRILEDLPNSRELFKTFKSELETGYLTDIQRAARYYYLIKISFGAKKKNYGCMVKSISNGTRKFCQIQERLQNVIIENLSFERLIKNYDRPGTLFYLDPPYIGTEQYYEFPFTIEDHEKLRDILSKIKGKFLLSYNDSEQVKELYSSFNVQKVDRQSNLTAKSNASKMYKELIIKNY